MDITSTQFLIQSSDPLQLEKAIRVAKDFAQPYAGDEVVGIVFLGAIARGYYDASADIDITFFKKHASAMPMPASYLKVEGFEIHSHVEDYQSEIQTLWDMAKRWTYSQRQIYYDPKGLISRLLQDKVPLQLEEKSGY
jgi:hypothetical protein